jgi:hypothetical protein
MLFTSVHFICEIEDNLLHSERILAQVYKFLGEKIFWRCDALSSQPSLLASIPNAACHYLAKKFVHALSISSALVGAQHRVFSALNRFWNLSMLIFS